MNKLLRITTVPISLKYLIKGQMRFMSTRGFEVLMMSASGEEIEEVIKYEQCKHVELPLTRKITPIQDLKAVLKLYRFLKKEKPTIVHTHTPKAGIVGMLASYLARVPNRLHTVAGLPLLEIKGVKRKVLNLVEKLTYKCATKVYPNSKGLKKIILDNKFTKKDKLKVIANGSSNGIDTSYFNPELYTVDDKKSLKEQLNIKPADFVFIFVGRIVGDKGVNELAAAFEKLSKEREDVKLVLVGWSEDELDPLKKKTSAILANNKQIIAVGFQNDVRPYFAIADALVFPSYREGFPNVVLQAGAMNLPCIVTNINGSNEIIEEGKNGMIIPVKNATVLFDAMVKMMTDTQLKLKAREMITSRFEQKVVWEALFSEYKSLEINV